jgi:hypothetical protein
MEKGKRKIKGGVGERRERKRKVNKGIGECVEREKGKKGEWRKE